MPSYRFGKHPPKIDYRTLRFKTYLAGQPAPAPASADSLARVFDKLGDSHVGKLFPMDGNDRLGDCTVAAMAHAVTVFRGLLGVQRIMGQQVVEKLYAHLTGGPDTGLDEAAVLGYWRKHAVSGDRILGYVGIDPKNHEHIKQAIQIFGGVYLGFQVQENCQQQFDARQPWTSGRLTNDGHAVFATGYDAAGVTVLTWGNTQKGTWDWWDECVDEAYAVLPPEAKDRAYAGFDMKQLLADLSAVAN